MSRELCSHSVELKDHDWSGPVMPPRDLLGDSERDPDLWLGLHLGGWAATRWVFPELGCTRTEVINLSLRKAGWHVAFLRYDHLAAMFVSLRWPEGRSSRRRSPYSVYPTKPALLSTELFLTRKPVLQIRTALGIITALP